jgi:hypothetical protein
VGVQFGVAGPVLKLRCIQNQAHAVQGRGGGIGGENEVKLFAASNDNLYMKGKKEGWNEGRMERRKDHAQPWSLFSIIASFHLSLKWKIQ